MTEKQIAAVRKLREDNQKEGGNSKYARAVYTSVCDALVGFCEQNEEFADAILQQDKTLGACCDEIMQKCGTSISDLEVYARAVEQSPYLTRFKTLMETFQEDYKRMLGVIAEAEQAEPDTAAKLRTVLERITDSLKGV